VRFKQYINENIGDLTGQVIVITGANSGIGFEASRFLAYRGATIVMACRNLEKAKISAEKIIEENSGAIIHLLPYDQSSFASIDNFIELLKQKFTRINVLICNAGIYSPSRHAEMLPGLKLTIGTNFIGLYYLMRQITPYLDVKGVPTRVVFVSSLSAYHQPIRSLNYILTHNNSLFQQYANSKLAINRLFHVLAAGMNLHDFQDRKNISFYLMHPGVTSTNIIHNFPKWFADLGRFVLRIFVHHADKAALGIALLAGAPHVFNGSYYVPRGFCEISGKPIKKTFPKRMIKGSGQFLYDVGKFVKQLEKGQ